ncbi:MAG: hypothetical protein NTW86_08595 [Candidatus Sumerlaeota bacterium]|nr:hypothetical protein [Candidatus Sumerlaeota bacterium]
MQDAPGRTCPADLILDKRVDGVRVEPPAHATNFSALKDGVLTIEWKGQNHTIDLRREAGVHGG